MEANEGPLIIGTQIALNAVCDCPLSAFPYLFTNDECDKKRWKGELTDDRVFLHHFPKPCPCSCSTRPRITRTKRRGVTENREHRRAESARKTTKRDPNTDFAIETMPPLSTPCLTVCKITFPLRFNTEISKLAEKSHVIVPYAHIMGSVYTRK